MLENRPNSLRPSWFIRGRLHRALYVIRTFLRVRNLPSYECDPGKIILFLISRDLYSCLCSLVERCTAAGVLHKNIFIIDQGTTNEACKAAYAVYQAQGINLLSVSKRSEAFGPYVTWLDDSVAAIVRDHNYPYIVTDADLQFPDDYPKDWLIRMIYLLNTHKLFSKISLPLLTTDIDVDNRHAIIKHEGNLGSSFIYFLLRTLSNVPPTLRVCQSDTTFSLYRPDVDFSTISIRLESDYGLLHMPWYKCFVASQEYKFYKRNKRSEFGMWS